MQSNIFKSTLILILSIGLISVSFTQNIDEKEKSRFKKTRVYSETLMGYQPDEYGKASDIGVKKSTRLVDKNGNVTSIIEYNADSKPVRRSLFKYDKSGKVIKGLEYKGYDLLVDQYSFTYNKKGLKTSKKGFRARKEYEVIYVYDSANRLIKKTKSVSGSLTFTYRYMYENNKLAKEEYSSSERSISKNYYYNSKGQLTKEENNTDSFKGYTFEYEYDSLGNRVKETKFSIDNLPYESFKYSYDKNKKIIQIIKNNLDGVPVFKWNYSFDGKGNLEIVKLYDIDMTKPIYITKYLYKYHKPTLKTD